MSETYDAALGIHRNVRTGSKWVECADCGELSDTTAPAYYQLPEGATQLWDVITALGLTHCHASALEYVYRAGRKPGVAKVHDLRKAVANLEYEIARLEARE